MKVRVIFRSGGMYVQTDTIECTEWFVESGALVFVRDKLCVEAYAPGQWKSVSVVDRDQPKRGRKRGKQ